MKGAAAAIIVVLSATALLAAAGPSPVTYNAQKYIDDIVESLRKVTVKTTELASEYIISAKDDNIAPSESGKLALASKLIHAAGNLRHVAMLEALDSEKIRGLDFVREMNWLIHQQLKADSLMDAKLDNLIKLADDIPKAGLNRYVREVIDGLYEHFNFLAQMLKDGPK